MRGIVILALSSCLEPTEIHLSITTDVPCSKVRRTEIFFDTISTPIATTNACTTNRIGDFVLVPSNNGSGGIVIVKMELDTGSCDVAPPVNCIVARRQLRFVAHTTLAVPIELDQGCVDLVCPATQTCSHGLCVNSEIK